VAGSPDSLFFLRLWTAAHRAERLVAREIEADGVAGRQLALLLLVELHEPATPTTLAAALGVPFMTASDALQRLVADGDVAQEPNPDDRRSHLYALTESGRSRLRAIEAPLRRAVASVRGATDSDAGALAAAVAELDEALARALQ
jgi:DNA-binding MarR family transcriptional regulator